MKKVGSKVLKAFRFSDSLMLIMAIFTVTFFAYKDFDIRMLYGYGLLCIFLFFNFVRRLAFKKGLEIPSSSVGVAFIAVITICVMFLRPDSRHDDDTIVYILSMLICSGYLLFAEPSKKEYGRVIGVLLVGAILFTAFVLFFWKYEELFWDTYFPLLSRASKVYVLKYINRGYNAVLGGSCTITDYVIMLGVAVLVGQILSKQKKWFINALYLIPLVIFILAIMIVGRRGELLAIGVTVVFIYGLTQNKKQLIIKITTLAAIGLVLLWAFVVHLEELKEITFLRRYVMTIEDILMGQDTTSGRFELYGTAFTIFLKNPLLGIGWGSFSDYVTTEFQAAHGSAVADVHNIYLQFLCETGIIGTALILTPIFYVFIKTVAQTKRLYNASERGEDIILAAKLNGISLTIQTFFLVVGFLDPCFSKNIFWCFFILSAKMLDSATRLEKHTETNRLARFYQKIVSAVINKVKRR